MLARVRRFGKRRVVLGCLLLAALFCGASAAQRFWPVGPGVNPANFHKIALGMPEAEVEKILGGPPLLSTPVHLSNDMATWREFFPDWPQPYPPGQPDPVCRQWVGNRCLIAIAFDGQDRVVARHCGQESYAAMARGWLADQWSKTPQGRKARIERILQSCPALEEDSKFSPAELLEYVHDRYDIVFLINPADFGLQDAQELLQQQVGLETSAKKDLRANLDELLGKVKATYVVEDDYIRIVPAPPK
jgi:hypothetical protein